MFIIGEQPISLKPQVPDQNVSGNIFFSKLLNWEVDIDFCADTSHYKYLYWLANKPFCVSSWAYLYSLYFQVNHRILFHKKKTNLCVILCLAIQLLNWVNSCKKKPQESCYSSKNIIHKLDGFFFLEIKFYVMKIPKIFVYYVLINNK